MISMNISVSHGPYIEVCLKQTKLGPVRPLGVTAMTLSDTLHAWGTPDFKHCFTSELEKVSPDQLPLQQALAHSSRVSNEPFSVTMISSSDDPSFIHVKAGVFYSGFVGGGSCIDLSSPADTIIEHCELQVDIDKKSGNATVTLLPS